MSYEKMLGYIALIFWISFFLFMWWSDHPWTRKD